ncbi:hypothetical protein [Nocardioides limicola]|uniref:hypothetical protein n=1 Tax=Nocardioides limicola TaxID=2803368 RepID=UPI00193B848C|nr:hypothetical protein [Nocardioides sp. DJM-14]
MKQLPVPLEFRLPNEHWEPMVPETLGVEYAAFLAVRRNLDPAYSPTITISGDYRLDEATLSDIADEAVAKYQGQVDQLRLLQRQDIGSAEAPGISQLIGMSAPIDGTHFDLRQGQILMALIDQDDPTKRVVLIYTLSCTADQLAQMSGEFQEFLASTRPFPEQQG